MWTRAFIMSTVMELPDLKSTTARLLRNPSDFAKVLCVFYGDSKAKCFEKLLTEHLMIGGDLVNASKNKNTALADKLRKQWYENADKIAAFLARINPNWNESVWRKMLYSHLEMTEREAGLFINQKYEDAIKLYAAIESEAFEMADIMTRGIIKQFDYS